MESHETPVRYDTKIAVVLRDDLQVWQRLNVTAFLISGLGTVSPEVIGEPYRDAENTVYLPMSRQPVVVLAAAGDLMATVHARAIRRDLTAAVFPMALFDTSNDDDNRAAVRTMSHDGMKLAGMLVYGPRNAVDRVVKGATLHS
jgi:hypothetical protein